MAQGSAPTESFVDLEAGGLLGKPLIGLRFAFGGVPFVFSHMRLLSLAIIPIVMNIILFTVFVVGGIQQIPAVVEWASFGIDPESFWYFLETLWAGVVYLVTLIVTLLGGFFVTLVLGNLLAGPIYDLMSERTEIIVLGRSAAAPFTIKSFLAEVLGEMANMGARLLIYFLGVLLIFGLGFIPLLGQVIGVVGGPTWSWQFITLELLNASLARHQVPGFQRIGYVFSHKSLHLGFGGASWLMLWIPVTMPFLVVGATRLYLALAAWDHAPSKLSDADKLLLRRGATMPTAAAEVI